MTITALFNSYCINIVETKSRKHFSLFGKPSDQINETVERLCHYGNYE